MQRSVTSATVDSHPDAGAVPPPSSDTSPFNITELPSAGSSIPFIGPATPTSAARFTILALHAEGGLGRVLRARDEQLRRTVALKEILPDRADDPLVRRRFLAEAEITGRLEHPGIVPIYALEYDAAGRPVYAMRFIQGRTLGEAIQAYHQQPTPLGLRELLQRFIAVCQTLAYAHSQGVLHRDLKPANVMLGDYGETLVVDWGLAKRLDAGSDPVAALPDPPPPDTPTETGSAATVRTVVIEATKPTGDNAMLTAAGQILGTPAYMAPEQARGEIDRLGPPADVYALGAILHEILTGQPPYTGRSTVEVLMRVLGGAPPALEVSAVPVPRALRAVCLRALAREAAQRYPTAEELAREMERWLGDEPVAAYREPLRDRVSRWARRHRTLVTALGVAVFLLAAAGAGFTWWQQQQAMAEAVREHEEQQRQGRNAEAVAGLLDQCESALRAGHEDTAALVLEAAERRAAEGGAEALADRLDRCRTDLAVLRDLDEIDNFRWGCFRDEAPPPNALVEMARALFARLGVVPGLTPTAEAARRIADSHLKERLVAILDRWPELLIGPPPVLGILSVPRAAPRPDPGIRDILRAADPDPFRDAYRDALFAGDVPRAAAAALSPEALAQPPSFLAVMGDNPALPVDRRRELLQVALRARPRDLGLLMALGRSWYARGGEGTEERLRWFQAAVAAHPNRVAPHAHLASVLGTRGDQVGGLASYREAIRCDPTNALLRLNLGSFLLNHGELDAAIESFREAVRLHPKHPKYHSHLGYILCQYKKDYIGSEACLREALRLAPGFDQAHGGMGLLREAQDDPDGAIRAYQLALRCNPRYVLAFKRLGDIYENRGDLGRAIYYFREILRDYPNDPWYPGRLKQTERMRALLPRLGEILAGRARPASPVEGCEFALLCAQPYQQRYVAAARLYDAAFTADPKLADDLPAGHRYRAACRAVLATIGRGADVSELTPADGANLRGKALGWLRADLALRKKQAGSANEAERKTAANSLSWWLADADLVGVRPGLLRIGMPADERAAWDALWAEVRQTVDEAKKLPSGG